MKSIGWVAMLAMLSVTMCGGLMVGCQANTEPIERATNTLMDKVIGPAVEKGVAELSSRSAALQGQASAINPGYRVKGHVLFGTGLSYDTVVSLDGVSGNLAGNTSADQGPDLKSPAVDQIPDPSPPPTDE